MEIIPGILQIKLPLRDNPVDHVNTYLIRGDEGWVMVDTGWNDPEALEDLARQLKSLGMDFQDINQIIYTHIHPDHFGLAGTLKQRYGTRLVCHKIGVDSIEYRYFNRQPFIHELGNWHPKNGGNSEHADAVIEMSTDYTNHVAPVFPDTTFDDGEVISVGQFNLEVIWTPGHDFDHVCFYERNHRILFSGDHILPDTIPHIGVQVETPHNPHGHYMESLRSMRSIQAALVLPGHERTFDNLVERIEELLSYHEDIKSDIYKLLCHEPKTAYQIASEIAWMERPIKWNSLLPVVQAGLATKTLAYLEALRVEKRVEKVDKNGLTIYNAT